MCGLCKSVDEVSDAKLLRVLLDDWENDDAEVRKLARIVLPDGLVDGDSWQTPTVVDIVRELVEVILNLREPA